LVALQCNVLPESSDLGVYVIVEVDSSPDTVDVCNNKKVITMKIMS
jgi:hypothetical protein